MAYYIDDSKNTAVKAEGKVIYGWNHESRRFDLPVSDPTPKSRMERTSDFEARRYLFEHDPRRCYERIWTLADKVQARPAVTDETAITVERAEADLKDVEAFVEGLLPEVSFLQSAVDEYGMAMSDAGRCLSNCLKILETDIQLARNDMELAKLKELVKKCESGHCEECPYYRACDKKKN